MSLWSNKICHELFDSLEKITQGDVIQAVFESIHDCLDIVEAAGVTSFFIQKFTEQALKQCQTVHDNIKDHMKQQSNGQDDDDQYEDEKSNDGDDEDEDENFDEYIFTELSRCFHALFKIMGAELLPIVKDKMVPFYSFILSNPNHSVSLRHDAICFFDDMIEFTGPLSASLSQFFLSALAQSLTDTDADLRQAAAYGIGMCAQKGGDFYTNYCIGKLLPIHKMMTVFLLAY